MVELKSGKIFVVCIDLLDEGVADGFSQNIREGRRGVGDGETWGTVGQGSFSVHLLWLPILLVRLDSADYKENSREKQRQGQEGRQIDRYVEKPKLIRGIPKTV